MVYYLVMASIVGKRQGNQTYYYLVESARVDDPRNALRAIRTAAKALGMSAVGLHMLRYSFATHMLAAGVPLHTVSELLGHSSVAVTGDVYGHVSTDGARSAVGGSQQQ